MAPPPKIPRAVRPRRTLRPLTEGLETRAVPTAAPSASFSPLVLMSPAGGSGTPQGYSPQQVRAAYGFNQIQFGSLVGNGTGQTIAIVDAYDNPAFVSSTASGFLSSDLAKFDQQFGLPNPPSFTKLNQFGQASPLPATDPAGPGNPNGTWENEIAMDVEWAHAMAPGASMVLVEANSSNSGDLFTAAHMAASLPGVSVVSLSWGGPEFSSESAFNSNFSTPPGHSGVTFVAASGDGGAPGLYPAYSTGVLAVGGTALQVGSNGTYQSETGWSSSGGGISTAQSEPSFQNSVQQTGHRTIPDVSFVASPSTPLSVYDSYDNTGSGPWVTDWGTSLGAPAWGALVAIADQGRVASGGSPLDGASQTLPAIYGLPSSDFHDVTSGSNGKYSAGKGYDMVTGLGSPVANRLAPDLAFYGMPDHLAITSGVGSSIAAGQSIGLTIAVERPDGTVDTAATGTLTVSLATEPGTGTLGGTLTATIHQGMATFSGLSIQAAGSGYSLLVLGDGSEVISPSFVVTPAAAAQLVMTSQPPSSVVAGTNFGLTVDVEDAFGNLVTTDSSSVSLSVAGGGSLGGTANAIASGGVANFTGLSLDAAGAGRSITAADGSLASATSNPITVTPASASKLVIEAGPPTGLNAGTPFGMTVQAEDAFGNLQTGYQGAVSIAITAGPPGTSLLGILSVSAANGVATFPGLSIDTAGSGDILTATASNLASSATAPFAVAPGSPFQLLIESGPPSSVTAGSPFGLTAEVVDAHGNAASSYKGPVTVGLQGGPAGALLGGTTTLDASSGWVTFSGLNLADAATGYTIRVTGEGILPSTSAPLAVTPAAPAQLAITQSPSSGLAAGSPFGLVVSVEDRFGNLVPDSPATVGLTLEGGRSGTRLDGVTKEPTSGGRATFGGLILDQANSSYEIQANSTGLTSATTGPLDVSPTLASRLVITLQPPSSVTAGASFGLGVSVVDAYGNVEPGYNGIVSLSIGESAPGTNLLGSTVESASAGIGAFQGLSIQQAGTVTIRAVADGVGSQITTPIQVRPASASQVVLLSHPSYGQVAGQTFGLTAAIEDVYGNVVPSNGPVNVSLATNPAGGRLFGPSTVDASNGIAVFSGLSIEKAGSGYTLSATSPGLAAGSPILIGVASGPPARLIVTSQPTGTVIAHRPFVLGVEAVDAFGNPASGFHGSITAALSPSTHRGRSRRTFTALAVDGRAILDGRIVVKPGRTYSVTITGPGLSPAVTSVFQVGRPTDSGTIAAFRRARHRITRADLPAIGLGGPVHLIARRHR